MSRATFRTWALLTLCAFAVVNGPRLRTGRHHRVNHRRRQGHAGRCHAGRRCQATHEPSGTTYEGRHAGGRALCHPRHESRWTVQGRRPPYSGFATAEAEQRHAHPRRDAGPGVLAQAGHHQQKRSTSSPKRAPCSARPERALRRRCFRQDLASLPTISGRLTDITRLTPQYGGNGRFAGQDNRANNITVDGSYFNGSFGLRRRPAVSATARASRRSRSKRSSRCR